MIASTSSAPNMLTLPPNTAFAFLLSSRASPRATTRKVCAPTRRQRVLAICAGKTPCPLAASSTVAVLTGNSRMAISGACSAKNCRTEARLITSSFLPDNQVCLTPPSWKRYHAIIAPKPIRRKEWNGMGRIGRKGKGKTLLSPDKA